MTEGLHFHPDGHRYIWNGVAQPSVTRISGVVDNFSHVPPEMLAYGALKGTAVHLATALDDAGHLDEESVDEQVRPYLEAWRTFRQQSGFCPTEIELKVVNGEMGYAGTLDRIGTLNGRSVVLDLKSGEVIPFSAGPQLAGYMKAYAWMVNNGHHKRPRLMPSKRFVVWLRPDARYQLIKYDSPQDWEVFRSGLVIQKFIEEKES